MIPAFFEKILDESRARNLVALLCVAFLVVYLVPLGGHALLEPDEGRYAEIPREMIESGDYITPKLNYVKYFEKPVLLYWANALSFKIFGANEFAARLPGAVSALLGIAVTGALGAYLYGRRTGVLAAVVTGTSLLYYAIATINLTDMLLAFFLTVTMASWFVAWRSGDRRWLYAFYAAMALGVLTKGLIAIVLPGGIVFCFACWLRRGKPIFWSLYLPGILLFFALAVPWFYLVCKANPDFFRFFFIQEHFLRYTTKMHGRYEPFWFFLPLILVGTMPWIGFFVGLLSKESIVRTPASEAERGANVFLLLWFGVILLFFSASSSKLIPYIVPCVPPLALLIASDLERIAARAAAGQLRRAGFAINAGFNLLFVAALFVYAATNDRLERAEGLFIAVAVAIPLLAGAVAAIRAIRNKKGIAGCVVLLALSSLCFVMALTSIYGPMGRTRSARHVSEAILALRHADETIAIFGEILQGIPFYTEQRVMLVDYFGELAYGAHEAPEAERTRWFPDKEAFLGRWQAGEPLILVVRRKRLDWLFPDGPTGVAKTLDLGDYLVFFNRERERDGE